MRLFIIFLLVATLLPLTGCGYRLIRADEIAVPNYEPREVLVPAECEALVRRAATEGLARFNETEARTLGFCQNQQLIRAQEEEAAARLLESHAAAAGFALQVVTIAAGALFAVLTWLF